MYKYPTMHWKHRKPNLSNKKQLFFNFVVISPSISIDKKKETRPWFLYAFYFFPPTESKIREHRSIGSRALVCFRAPRPWSFRVLRARFDSVLRRPAVFRSTAFCFQVFLAQFIFFQILSVCKIMLFCRGEMTAFPRPSEE